MSTLPPIPPPTAATAPATDGKGQPTSKLPSVQVPTSSSLTSTPNEMLTFKTFKLITLIALYFALFLFELLATQVTHSLTLLIDGYHNLYIAMSLLLLFISYKVSHEQTLKNTFGWARVEVLGSMFNVIFFVSFCFSVVVEGIQYLAHLHDRPEFHSPLLLAIGGCVGLILHFVQYLIMMDDKMVNEGGFVSIHGTDVQINFIASRYSETVKLNPVKLTSAKRAVGDVAPVGSSNNNVGICDSQKEEESHSLTIQKEMARKNSAALNQIQNLRLQARDRHCEALRVHSVFKCDNPCVHIIRDFAASFILVFAYFIINSRLWMDEVTETWSMVIEAADSCLGILAVFILLATLYPTVKKAGMILLQTVPQNLEVDKLRKQLKKEFPVLLDIHDLHIWSLTPDQVIATCHVILPWQTTKDYMQLTSKFQDFFTDRGINLVSLQPEFVTDPRDQRPRKSLHKCLYICRSENCDQKYCCNEKNEILDEIITAKDPLLNTEEKGV